MLRPDMVEKVVKEIKKNRKAGSIVLAMSINNEKQFNDPKVVSSPLLGKQVPNISYPVLNQAIGEINIKDIDGPAQKMVEKLNAG